MKMKVFAVFWSGEGRDQSQPALTSVSGWLLCLCCILPAPVMAMPGNSNVNQAVNMRQQGDLFESIRLLEQLKAADGQNLRVNLELAISYFKARRFTEARQQIDHIFGLSDKMKDNPRLNKLAQMIDSAADQAKQDTHQFKLDVTGYWGSDELTSLFTYDEFTEFDDSWVVERKTAKESHQVNYGQARVKGEYRYTPAEPFELFGEPTLAFWTNRVTWFEKKYLEDDAERFGYAGLDSALFVIQPKNWAFNIKLKGKWHQYGGRKTLTEKTADINGSLLAWGARFKLGYNYQQRGLKSSFYDELLQGDEYIFEEKSKLLSPYVKVSYRFSPDMLWSVGWKRRNIHNDNVLLEGHLTRVNSTLKYDVNSDLNLHLSYYSDRLDYRLYNVNGNSNMAGLGFEDLDSFELNTGELKRTVTFGAGYQLNEHWQVGINLLYMDKKQDNDWGQDQWTRLESFVRYRF